MERFFLGINFDLQAILTALGGGIVSMFGLWLRYKYVLLNARHKTESLQTEIEKMRLQSDFEIEKMEMELRRKLTEHSISNEKPKNYAALVSDAMRLKENFIAFCQEMGADLGYLQVYSNGTHYTSNTPIYYANVLFEYASPLAKKYGEPKYKQDFHRLRTTDSIAIYRLLNEKGIVYLSDVSVFEDAALVWRVQKTGCNSYLEVFIRANSTDAPLASVILLFSKEPDMKDEQLKNALVWLNQQRELL